MDAADVHQPADFLSDLRRRARRWTHIIGEDEGDPTPVPPPPSEPSDTTPDDAVCRICFSSESDASTGRLFSPCNCRGTMAKVHTECLDEWRRQSKGRESYFQCDQCGYRYRLGRTKIAGIASSPRALMAVTSILLLVLAFIAGNASFLILGATNMLPSAPPFESITYWFTGNTMSSPFWYGDFIHESVDESLSLFTLPNWLVSTPLGWFLQRVSLGAAVLGILSFLQLVTSFALLGHLHHLRLFRRGGRGQNRDGRAGERMDLAGLLVVAAVLFGLYRAFRALYYGVRAGAKVALRRLEERVLEVR